MTINRLTGIKHASEKYKRLREEVEGGVSSNDSIVKESGSAVGEREEKSCLVHLGTRCIGRDEF